MNKIESQIPTSIGIIMDGNRRYARSKGLPTLEGHHSGYQKLREVLKWAKEAGVKEMIVYAFSTENWNRTAEEVSYLMGLFRESIHVLTKEAIRDDVRIIFLGDRTRLEAGLQKVMNDAERETVKCSSFKFGIPDLIIRTSGEVRLSNFLPWQSVYSELVFTKTLWPEFSKEELLSILKNYSERERRLGK
ncbi:MAG: Isoprenyl transferase [Parcubacteria group bacterium GW2011_GWA2_47_7]|nr:MAG: Isoprenyl transferase [Parcubacteria group bacterium GW2011_GWA2_47_7]